MSAAIYAEVRAALGDSLADRLEMHGVDIADVVWVTDEDVEAGSVYRTRVDNLPGVFTVIPLLVIPHTYTDDTGHDDAVCVSNARYVEENYSDCDGVELVEVTYAMGGREWAVRLDAMPGEGEEGGDFVDGLLEIIGGLTGYPIIDDGALSEVEQEFAVESIDNHLVPDVVDSLPEDVEDAWSDGAHAAVVADMFHELYYAGDAHLEGEDLIVSKDDFQCIVDRMVAMLKGE